MIIHGETAIWNCTKYFDMVSLWELNWTLFTNNEKSECFTYFLLKVHVQNSVGFIHHLQSKLQILTSKYGSDECNIYTVTHTI